MDEVNIPVEQLEAIAEFWAGQYQYKASPDQMEVFKSDLRESVRRALNECQWRVEDPLWGSYNRRFITSHEYHPSKALDAALGKAGMRGGMFAFPCGTVLSIDPGRVSTHPAGEVIWQVGDFK